MDYGGQNGRLTQAKSAYPRSPRLATRDAPASRLAGDGGFPAKPTLVLVTRKSGT